MPHPIVRCEGWLIRGSRPIAFTINERPIEQITYMRREGLAELYPDTDICAFEFWFDANLYLEGGSRALHVAARWGTASADCFGRLAQQPPADREAQILYFMHMPRTGGTSVRVGLEQAIGRLTPQYHGLLSVYDEPGFCPQQIFETLSARSLNAIDIVYGHHFFGMHEAGVKICPDRPYAYMTMLCDPVDALLSFYFAFRQRVQALGKSASIYDFVAAQTSMPSVDFDNPFCRIITNHRDGAKPVRKEHLQQAIETIARDFLFVGVTEMMEVSTRRMSAILGIDMRISDDFILNTSAPSTERDGLDRAHFAREAHDLIRYDIELYNAVRAWLTENGNCRKALRLVTGNAARKPERSGLENPVQNSGLLNDPNDRPESAPRVAPRQLRRVKRGDRSVEE